MTRVTYDSPVLCFACACADNPRWEASPEWDEDTARRTWQRCAANGESFLITDPYAVAKLAGLFRAQGSDPEGPAYVVS